MRCAMSCTIATRVVAKRAVVRSTAPARSPRLRFASYARSRACAHPLWDSSPQPSESKSDAFSKRPSHTALFRRAITLGLLHTAHEQHVRQRPRVRYHSSAHATLPSWVVEVVTTPMRIRHTTTIGAGAARRTTRARIIRCGRRNSRGNRGAHPSFCSDVGGISEFHCVARCGTRAHNLRIRSPTPSENARRKRRFLFVERSRSDCCIPQTSNTFGNDRGCDTTPSSKL